MNIRQVAIDVNTNKIDKEDKIMNEETAHEFGLEINKDSGKRLCRISTGEDKAITCNINDKFGPGLYISRNSDGGQIRFVKLDRVI